MEAKWAAEAQQQAMALSALAPGSMIADLPQWMQNIFWELGNMHYEEDESGEDRFPDEKANLGYFQYLIRTAAAEGDMNKVMEHVQEANKYADTTLINWVDRELDEVVQQGRTELDPSIPIIEMSYDDIIQTNSLASFNTYHALEFRGQELEESLIDRNREHLSASVDGMVMTHQNNAIQFAIEDTQAQIASINMALNQVVSASEAPSQQSVPPTQEELTTQFYDETLQLFMTYAIDGVNTDGVSIEVDYSAEHPILQNGNVLHEGQPVDFREVTAEGLSTGIVDGRLEIFSVLRLIEEAHTETGDNETGDNHSYSPSSAALYALAFADAQGDNWMHWEDENAVPIIYRGKDGAWYTKNPEEGGQGSGNCANFTSMALLAGGANPSELWGLGYLTEWHDEIRDNPKYLEYYQGTTLFLGAQEFLVGIGQRPISNLAMWKPIDDIRDDDNYIQSDGRITLQNLVSPEYGSDNPVRVTVGDLIFSHDPDGSTDHVAIVVGWGPPSNNPGDIITTSGNRIEGIEFYHDLDSVPDHIDTDDWVPYIVDHGGDYTASYPRPWHDGISEYVWTHESNTNIAILDIKPRG